MTIDADTIRRTRKRLRNHGRRTDGTFYGHDADNVDHVLWAGPAFTDQACLIGALALETGEWYATQEAALAAYQRHIGPAGRLGAVADWNDHATDDQVFDLLDKWEAELL